MLKQEQRLEFIRSAKKGNEEAMESLIEMDKAELLKTTKKIYLFAQEQYDSGMLSFMPEYGDIYQEVILHYEQSVFSFDENKNKIFNLQRTAYFKTLSSLKNYLKCNVSFTIHEYEIFSKIQQYQRVYFQKYGIYPSIVEIAEELKVQPKLVNQYLFCCAIGSQIIPYEEDMKGVNSLEEIEQFTRRKYLYKVLKLGFSQLSERERKILSMRFGLIDGTKNSRSIIARQFQLSVSGIREIEKAALLKLYKFLKYQPSQSYLDTYASVKKK